MTSRNLFKSQWEQAVQEQSTVSLLSSSDHWCWVSCPGNSSFAFSILNNWSKLYYSFLFGGLFFTWICFTTSFTLSTTHKEKIMKILASCLSGRGSIKEHEVQLWQPPDSSTATVLIFRTNHVFCSDTFHKPNSWNAWRLKTINFTKELLKRGHILGFKKSPWWIHPITNPLKQAAPSPRSWTQSSVPRSAGWVSTGGALKAVKTSDLTSTSQDSSTPCEWPRDRMSSHLEMIKATKVKF